MAAKADSLGKRYLFKLASNFASIPLYLVMEGVLPRALGPASYGNYAFSTVLFQNFTNFLDMGTSTCLSTSLAKRQGEFGLIAFYFRVGLFMLAACLLAGGATYIPGASDLIMPGVPAWMALPAALWAYVTWTGRVSRSMNDALGITTRSELVRVGVNIFSAVALLTLFLTGLLSLPTLFLHQYVTLGLMAAGFIFILRRFWKENDNAENIHWRLSREQLRSYMKEFRRYSSPLFVTALFSALMLSGERWLLQFFEGSVQQGYFSLSQKLGAACFLFVTAITPLLMREMAVAHGNKDASAIARLLDRYAPMVYAFSAWLACFILIEAQAVVNLFGGRQFAEAMLPVQIMALYPVHQGYGQLAGAVFYAAGETRLLRNLSIVTMSLGLVFAWFMLAPSSMGGLQLGATGLALKMVLIQMLTVNLLFFFGRKIAPFGFGRNVLHQVVCLAVLLGLASVTRYMTEFAGLGSASSIPRFFCSGFLYVLLSIPLAFVFPFVFGLAKGEVRLRIGQAVSYFSKRNE